MRLISQDGMIDVPYEQVSVELRDCDIWCGYYPTLSQHLISKKFATYSNTDKALKVMEMLRDCYSGKDCGYHTEHDICYHSRDEFETKVFKFPDDSEVEV